MNLKNYTIDSPENLEKLFAWLKGRHISHIGVAFEYSFGDQVLMGDDFESIQAKAELKVAWEEHCQIQGMAIRYGVSLPGTAYRPWLMECAGSARIYEHQVGKAVMAGSDQYLKTIEMPWVVTNAGIEWAGLNIDHDKAAVCKKIVDERVGKLKGAFQKVGLNNPGSNSQLIDHFRKLHLLPYFRVEGGTEYSFDKDILKRLRDLHPHIPVIRVYKKLWDLLSFGILSRGAAGSDGRIHPCHIQLGAHTGRQTSTGINVLDDLCARIIIPLHDSFIIETPLEHVGRVSEETARIMKETVSSAFPQLKPQVDINNMHPECWNKDGNIDAFEQWITEISGTIENFTRNPWS